MMQIIPFEEKYKDNTLLLKTFKFALDIIDYCDELNKIKAFKISDQLIRCGTSVGANAKESQNCESRADFIHKLKISFKESDESEYWLYICHSKKHYPPCEHLIRDIQEIMKLLGRIVSTAKNNQKQLK
jgi:four helix bundle protein